MPQRHPPRAPFPQRGPADPQPHRQLLLRQPLPVQDDLHRPRDVVGQLGLQRRPHPGIRREQLVLLPPGLRLGLGCKAVPRLILVLHRPLACRPRRLPGGAGRVPADLERDAAFLHVMPRIGGQALFRPAARLDIPRLVQAEVPLRIHIPPAPQRAPKVGGFLQQRARVRLRYGIADPARPRPSAAVIRDPPAVPVPEYALRLRIPQLDHPAPRHAARHPIVLRQTADDPPDVLRRACPAALRHQLPDPRQAVVLLHQDVRGQLLRLRLHPREGPGRPDRPRRARPPPAHRHGTRLPAQHLQPEEQPVQIHVAALVHQCRVLRLLRPAQRRVDQHGHGRDALLRDPSLRILQLHAHPVKGHEAHRLAAALQTDVPHLQAHPQGQLPSVHGRRLLQRLRIVPAQKRLGDGGVVLLTQHRQQIRIADPDAHLREPVPQDLPRRRHRRSAADHLLQVQQIADPILRQKALPLHPCAACLPARRDRRLHRRPEDQVDPRAPLRLAERASHPRLIGPDQAEFPRLRPPRGDGGCLRLPVHLFLDQRREVLMEYRLQDLRRAVGPRPAHQRVLPVRRIVLRSRRRPSACPAARFSHRLHCPLPPLFGLRASLYPACNRNARKKL